MLARKITVYYGAASIGWSTFTKFITRGHDREEPYKTVGVLETTRNDLYRLGVRHPAVSFLFKVEMFRIRNSRTQRVRSSPSCPYQSHHAHITPASWTTRVRLIS